MNASRKSLLIALLLALAFPASSQVVSENPAEAARIAAPLREELLSRMDSWKPILFADSESDPVRTRFGARYDALEAAVRGQKHPGDIARSRYAFERLLDDALHARRDQDKRAGKSAGGYDAFRAQAERQAAEGARAAAISIETSRRAAAIVQTPASTLFDGSALGSPVPTEAAPAATELLPAQNITSSWGLAPIAVTPAYALAHAYAVDGVPSVSYNNGETRTGGSRAWRNNNPGNIIATPWTMEHGAIAKDEKGYAIFPDGATAMKALDRLLGMDAYQDLQLNAAVAKYAPPSENPTAKYVAFLARKTGVDEWAALSSMTRAQLDAFKKWITVFEGSKPGAVTRH
ncbi:MAG: hypothetical protein ACHQ51_01450 [Elusimicrobiota bacterium]